MARPFFPDADKSASAPEILAAKDALRSLAWRGKIIERGEQNAGSHQEVHLQAMSHTFRLTALAAPTDDCTRLLDPKIDRCGRKTSYDEIAELLSGIHR